MRIRTILSSITIAAFTLRCATVNDGTYQRIAVSTEPSGASIAVDCGSAAHHVRKTTPATIKVPRRADPCKLLVTKEGYENESIALKRVVSPRAYSNFHLAAAGVEAMSDDCCDSDWFAFLALLTAGSAAVGAVGMTVDRATGAIFEHTPEVVSLVLHPSPDDSTEAEEDQSN
jgi:hypothetical protein